MFTFFVVSCKFLSRSYVVGCAETDDISRGDVIRDGFPHKPSVKKGG